MNTNSSLRRIWIGLFALIALSYASRTFAAVDAYLEIKDEKGKVTKAKILGDGSFESPALPAGIYVCSFQFGVGRGISSPTGSSADRAKPKSVTFTYEIKAPRDQSTGMASGKRMHKPFVITKELDAASPGATSSGGSSLRCSFQKITIENACDGMKGTIVVTDTKGSKMAMDDWSAPN